MCGVGTPGLGQSNGRGFTRDGYKRKTNKGRRFKRSRVWKDSRTVKEKKRGTGGPVCLLRGLTDPSTSESSKRGSTEETSRGGTGRQRSGWCGRTSRGKKGGGRAEGVPERWTRLRRGTTSKEEDVRQAPGRMVRGRRTQVPRATV